MNGLEVGALCILVLIIVVLPIGIVAYRQGYLSSADGEIRVIDLVARRPEAGGWSPEVITVNKGDRVRLRITASDVLHGFAIGRIGVDVGWIYPGEITEVEFTADQAGRFPFYCNVWCSPFHYRMRGTLAVVDPSNPEIGSATDGAAEDTPVETGLDLDAPHVAELYPTVRPSAVRGEGLYGEVYGPRLPSRDDLQVLHKQSPSSVVKTILAEVSPVGGLGGKRAVTAEEAWDLTAYLWSLTTSPQNLAQGQELYLKNCSGCHGEMGAGNGPGARHLETAPTAFTEAKTMAGGTSEIYLAKMRRGGMGTGMPYWGPIFTREESSSVIDYLWQFLFSYGEE